MKTLLPSFRNTASFLTIALLLAFCGKGFGQVSNYGYTALTGQSYVTITSATTLTSASNGVDDGYNVLTLPFSFTYNSIAYTQATVSTNGYIVLGSASPTGTTANLFSGATGSPAISGWGRDGNMNTGNAGSMQYGSAAGGLFVVQFNNMASNGSGNTSNNKVVNFQIVLYGPSSAVPGRIDIIYGSNGPAAISTGAQIGVRDVPGTWINGLSGSTSSTATATAFPASGQLYRFSPQGNLSVSSSSLSFTSTVSGTTSASQSFNLSGTTLTGFPGTVTVNAPSTDFEVSNNNTAWGASTTIPYSSATLAATPVYVRFTPQTNGAKSGMVTLGGGGDPSPPTVTVTGTGTASAASDIITGGNEAASLAPSQTGTTIPTTANGTRVWSFTVRDGGGATDLDNLPTILNAVTITPGAGNTATWTSTIQEAALFSGSTFIANVSLSANQIVFTGLSGPSVTAPDGGTAPLDLYVTFKTGTVVDNSQLQFQITSANTVAATAGSSTFAAFSAASSSTTGGLDKINITATAFAFGTGPSTVVSGAVMSPSVTVKAVDANGNTDLSYAGTVALAVTGSAFSGTATTSVGASSGIATFTNLIFTTSAAAASLTASGSLTSATSGNFVVSPGALAKFSVSQTIGTQTAGTAFPLGTIIAQDANGNTVTSFTGAGATVAISTSNGTVSPTTSGTFTNGVLSSISVTVTLATNQAITVSSGGKTGTTNTFGVNPGALSKFSFATIGTQVAGTAFSVTITAQDANGNTVTSFNSTTNMTSNAGTITPAVSNNFVSGTVTQNFSVTLAGTNRTITATSGSTGTSNTFTVSPGALASLTMSTVASPEPVDSSFTSSVTITGKDAYGNLVNGGNVNISTTAGSITPATVTLSASGTVTVSNFKVTQSGTGQTITATSAANSAIFVVSNAFMVNGFNSSATWDYFRSAISADWASASTWQGSHDGTNWYIATAYPSSTATSILVQSIHNITVTTSVSSSALTISGTLTVTGNLSSTGATASTPSTLKISAGGTYTHNQDGGTVPAATWDLASNCVISGIKSNAPSGLGQGFGNMIWSSNMTGSYIDLNSALTTINGSFTFSSPATSNSLRLATDNALTLTVKGSLLINNAGILRLTDGASSPVINVTGALSLTSGSTLDFGAGTNFGTNGSGTINLSGNYNESGASSRLVSGFGANGTVNFTGTAQSVSSSLTSGADASNVDFNVKSGSNVTMSTSLPINNAAENGNSSTFTVNSGGTLVCGTNSLTGIPAFTQGGFFGYTNTSTFNLQGGGSLQIGSPAGITLAGTASGNIQTAVRTFNVAGNYTYNNSTTVQSTGSGLPATITGNLTVNNNGGSTGVTLSQATSLSGTLFLTNGLLTTTSNLLSLSSTAPSPVLAVSDYTNASYINGPVQKTGTTAFTFPVGKLGTGYVPIAISNTTATQTFRAEYIRSIAAALGSIASGSPLQRVSSCDYWNLNLYNSGGTQIASLPSGTIAVTLFWNQNNSCNVIHDLSTLAIGHFATTWDVIGLGAYTTTGIATNGSITYAGATNFSPFALATTNGTNNPLPITLDYFTATKQVGYNKVTWKVECTSSSSSFDVERSYDEISFEAINTVKVTSASDCALPFVYDDYNSNGNKIYYRIKMVDIDDNAKYSNIEMISNSENVIELMSIQPNPVYGNGTLKISASASQNIELAIIGIDGKQMQHKTIQVQQGTNTVQLNTGALVKGIYFVKGIFANGQTNIIKFIKQ